MRKSYYPTKEHRMKMRLAKLGKKQSFETRMKISLKLMGKNNPNYKHGKYKELYHNRYNDMAYKVWRSSVFERDNWTCQTCGKRSSAGDIVYLTAHHIKS